MKALPQSIQVPQTEEEYQALIDLLNFLTDKVGKNESHLLAPLMDATGILVEKYEDEHVPELRS